MEIYNRELGYLPEFFRNKENQGKLMRYYVGYYGYGNAEEHTLITKVHLSFLQEYAFDVVLGYLSTTNCFLTKTDEKINFLDLENLIEQYNVNESSLEEGLIQEIKDKEAVERYKNSYEWLPRDIRSFDNFKRIFLRYIPESEEIYNKHKEVLHEINGQAGCIFFIDYFMWMMANFGYTLEYKK